MPLRLLSCTLLLLLLPTAGHETKSGATAEAPLRSLAPTTIVVVRHAEKGADDPRDPLLSAAGERRARALLEVVADAGVAAIYSTQYRRTRSTVEPLAERLGLSVQIREIASGQAELYAAELAREIFRRHAGQSVVVVGHSNTVPQLVRALSARTVADLTEQEYDHLYVVVVPPQGEARLYQARYGAADPFAVGQQSLHSTAGEHRVAEAGVAGGDPRRLAAGPVNGR